MLLRVLLLLPIILLGQCSIINKGNGMYKGYKLYRAEVFPVQLPMVDSLENNDGVEIWSWLYRPSNSTYQVDVLTAPQSDQKVLEVLSDVHLSYSTVIKDLQEEINSENLVESPEFTNMKNDHPMTWNQYHGISDMEKYMKYLALTYPDLVELLAIGKSHEESPLYVVKVSDGKLNEEGKPKPGIWIDGGVHAREWISPAVVSYFLHRLVELPGKEQELISSFDWYIMPVANPDGYEYSRTADRLWRKNRAWNGSSKCRGVDLNRNFDFKWSSTGSSSKPCSQVYRGSEAFSEPESRAIGDFLRENKNMLKAYVSIHSYKQLWMYPWAFSKAPLNAPATARTAKTATDAINDYAKTKQYTHGQVTDILYRAAGSSLDFAYGALGIPYSFALELRDRGEHGFLLPKEQIIPTAEETTVGLFAMAKQILLES